MKLTPAGQAIVPRALGAERPLTRELKALHSHARARANEIKSGLNVGAVRTAPMAKRASSTCIEGFSADMHRDIKKRVDELKAKLKPGDLINTNPRKWRGFGRIYKPVSAIAQGTRFGHTALYDGDGHVIESRTSTVIRRPIEDLVRCNQVVAVSPAGVSLRDRMRAVAWMKKNVGKDAMRVTIGGLVRHGLKPTVMSSKHERRRQELDRALCSSLIANAYAKVPFNEKRRIADTRPSDILHSDKVKIVGKIH